MTQTSNIKAISKRLKSFLLATAFVATQVVAPLTLSGVAAADPVGNNGTLQVHEKGDADYKKSNDPHVCVFNFEAFDLDANQTGNVTITPQPPTVTNGTPSGNPLVLSLSTDGNGDGATAYVNDANQSLALKDGHYKATLDDKFGTDPGNKAKSKVFWVDCEDIKPQITTQVSASLVNVGDNVYDTATLTGDFNHGDVTGQVKFYVCWSAVANPSCNVGGTQVGGPVTIVSGQANSANYSVTKEGFFCFRASYDAPLHSEYNDATHTNKTTECFQAVKYQPKGSVQVLKQVDEGDGEWVNANGENSDFKWGLDQESATRDMGSTAADVPAGSHSVTENTVDDYGLAGWFVGEGSCNSEQNSVSTPAQITVNDKQTTTVTFCNRVKQDRKVELCHATSSEGNAFNLISISPAGAYHGHLGQDHQNGEDIIPPFSYHGQTYSQNWDSTGQAIFRNGCKTLGDISGYKWNDANGDGQWNWNEHGISNWTIKLYVFKDGHYQYVDSDSTNVWGKYNFENLPNGNYKVCEGYKLGWVQTYPGSQTLWCHFVALNSDNHSATHQNFGNQGRGSITVVKNVDDGFGNVDHFAKGWTWNYWGKYQSGNHEKASLLNTEQVPAGKYFVSENNKKGYHFESLKCVTLGGFDLQSMGEQSFNQLLANGNDAYYINDKALVNVDPGEHVFCAFLNVRNTGSLTVVKDATPNDPQWFDFTVEGKNKCEYHKPPVFDGVQGLLNINTENNNENDDENCDKTKQIDEFSLQDYKDPTSATHTKAVETGWYKVTEDGVDGWVLQGITCGDAPTKVADNSVWVYVGNDKDVTCTFSNTKLAKVTVVKDARPDSLKAFRFTSDLTGESASFDLVDDGALPGVDSKSFAGLMPGTYHISEAATSGWTLKDIDCGEAQLAQSGSEITLTVEAGDDITCTFVNTKDPGHVLGASTTTGELPNTGNNPMVNFVAGIVLIGLAIATRWFGRKSQTATL